MAKSLQTTMQHENGVEKAPSQLQVKHLETRLHLQTAGKTS